MRLRILFVVVLLVVLLTGGLLWSVSTHAYDLPPVNLGFTSFLDGGPPAGPGFYFTQYLQYYTSTRFNDDDGDKLPFPDPEVDVFVSLSQFIYQSNQPLILGGKWGLDIIVPIVSLDTDYDQTGPFPEDNGTGIGDILVGPFIQWDPIMGEKGPKFMHRIELQLLLPTGKYDDEKELNPGSNFFSFNPYWAATAFITPELTASLRFHYLWNAVNDDPNRGFGDAEDTQAGQAIHTNMALGYEAIPKRLRVGVNGYYLKQISDTKMNGDDVSGLKEEVFGIGPGLVYHHSQEQHIFANVFFETLAENRTEGTRFTIRYVHHF
jgi:anthranilate 1,2-dioxygenase (deaminating, decarboxylating) large subunit